MFKKELQIKEEIIAKIEAERDQFKNQMEELTVKLQIPRTHMLFLRDKGKLEEFVEAKINGQEPVAKWLLLDNAKDELKVIEEKLARKEKERLEQEKRKATKPSKPKYSGPPNEA